MGFYLGLLNLVTGYVCVCVCVSQWKMSGFAVSTCLHKKGKVKASFYMDIQSEPRPFWQLHQSGFFSVFFSCFFFLLILEHFSWFLLVLSGQSCVYWPRRAWTTGGRNVLTPPHRCVRGVLLMLHMKEVVGPKNTAERLTHTHTHCTGLNL